MRLNDFIKYKAGSCRHRALLAAYLLEKLIEDGKVSLVMQSVAVVRGENKRGEAHAWVGARSTGNRLYIIDPIFGYAGDYFDTSSVEWNYSVGNYGKLGQPPRRK